MKKFCPQQIRVVIVICVVVLAITVWRCFQHY